MCEVVLIIHDETKETSPLDTVEPGEFDKQNWLNFKTLGKLAILLEVRLRYLWKKARIKFMKTERCQHTITSGIGTLGSRPIMSKNLPGKTDENTLATSLILDK